MENVRKIHEAYEKNDDAWVAAYAQLSDFEKRLFDAMRHHKEGNVLSVEDQKDPHYKMALHLTRP